MIATLSTEEKVELIKKHSFFVLLNENDIYELVTLTKEIHVPAGEVITQEKDLIDSIYFIAQGEAAVTRKIDTVENEIHLPLAKLQVGDAIGLSEVGFFSKNAKRTATVKAITDMVLLKIDAIQFGHFITQPTRLYYSLISSAEHIMQSNFLKYVNPDGELSPEKMHLLEQYIETITLPEQTTLFSIGDREDKLYLVKKGSVDILDADHQVLTMIETSQVFGESGMLQPSTHSVTARTREACEVLSISYDRIDQHLEEKKRAKRTLLSDDKYKPKHAHAIHVSDYETLDKERIKILNSEQKRYRLSNVGWSIWQLIDGVNSVADIVTKTHKAFNNVTQDEVMILLNDLMKKQFIS